MNNWSNNGALLIYRKNNIDFNNKHVKMAGFDIDGTIITTASGKRFPTDHLDYCLKYNNTINIITNLQNVRGYTIIFITNQSGLKGNKEKINLYKHKIEDICNKFSCDITVFICTEKDIWRKPNIEIINVYINKLDVNNSFFCGDAAGRNATQKYKKDFSDTDLKFALNLKIKFYTPEEIFNKTNVDDMVVHYNYIDIANIKIGKYHPFIPYKNKEVVINVGYPGSGKSYYTLNYITPHNYLHINQDRLKTKAKCLNEFKKALKIGYNIVIDNTNPSEDARSTFINLAKQFNYRIRIIKYTASKELAMHNSYYRSIVNNTSYIPVIAYNIYNKNYQEPSLDTKVDIIEEIDFVLDDKNINYDIYSRMLY